MRKIFKFKTQSIAFVYAMLVAVLFVGCKKDELYTEKQCENFKKGDTIYIGYAGEIAKGVVLKNDIKMQILELYRQNILSRDIYMNEIMSYDDIRFK